MTPKNQEISLEVAEKNETVTVDIKTPALFAEPLPTPTTAPTTAYKLQPHEEEFLAKAKSQKERDEIWIAIRADRQIRLRREQNQQIQQSLQTNRQHRKAFPTIAKAKKKRRAPLTILQTIRFKTGAKYNLIAAERIVAHICRRQGGPKNQERRGCFESIPNMAKACRIRINRFRKLVC